MTNIPNYNTMYHLFLHDFITHYSLPPLSHFHFIDTVNDCYFEIEDRVGIQRVSQGLGTAKISNPQGLTLSLVHYDSFITAISHARFKNALQRCDFILSDVGSFCVVLGEIKDRIPHIKVRKKSKDQLIASLKTIWNVPTIQQHLNTKHIKRCCYFNKQSRAPSTINATIAFNRLSNLAPYGIKMNCPQIEAFTFEFYEYLGNQIMQLV